MCLIISVLQDYTARNPGVTAFLSSAMNPDLINISQPNHSYRPMPYNQAPIMYTQNQPLPPGQAKKSPSPPHFNLNISAVSEITLYHLDWALPTINDRVQNTRLVYLWVCTIVIHYMY